MAKGPILIISGTNRPGANALKIAGLVDAHYRAAGLAAEVLSLGEMPREIFDTSSYDTKPDGMLKIQDRVLAASGLHVVTPEYNGSFPGVLKYFIDMLKFPESFIRKPVAFVGEAAGMWGALRSVEQLVAIFGYRNAHIFPEKVFISDINSKFSAAGEFQDAAISERLKTQAIGFAKFAGDLQSQK